jgi:glycoprotein 6-alpha-L-fucosyltransferase
MLRFWSHFLIIFNIQIHHAVYCFIVAYGTERTLILKSHGWRYNKKGFEDVFLPLSENCAAMPPGNHAYWPSPNAPVVEIPIIDSVNPRPKFLPPAIPRDLSERIIRLHGDPIVWWVSEFLRYILRTQPDTAKMLADMEKSMNFVQPIVGIHVRRTDKVGTEAAFHSVEEYMKYVSREKLKLCPRHTVLTISLVPMTRLV